MVNKLKVAEAVNLLIKCERYAKYANEMTAILEEWDLHPMYYVAHLTPLNALLDVGLESREAFERLLKLVEEKRKLLPKQRRVDYQRELMAARRARVAKAIELEELLHGPMDATRKEQYAKDIQGRWTEARNRFLEKQGELSWEQRNKKTQEFWAAVDAKLEANVATERKKRSKV
jgi:hypothetical protein